MVMVVNGILQSRAGGRAGVLPAVFIGQPVQGDSPLSTGTFEETFDRVVPPQLVILLRAAICWLEVGVIALRTPKNKKKKRLIADRQHIWTTISESAKRPSCT